MILVSMFLTSLSVVAVCLQTPMKITYAQGTKPLPKAVESAVCHTVTEMEQSWNTHDMDRYAALLTDDCQWVNVVGMWWNGKPSVVKAHVAFHHSIFKNVSYVTEQVCLKPISKSVMSTILTVKMDEYTTPNGIKVPSGETRLTLILLQKGDSWLISSAQNTPIDAVANQFDPGKH